MKKILILYCILAMNIVNAQKNIVLNINTGFPITSSGSRNFYIESSINKSVFKNIFLGIGLNYSKIDSKPTNNLLTYDRKTINYYISLGNSFTTKNSVIEFSPQVKIGYSLYSYSLNEFVTKRQSDNGFFAAPGVVVKYKLNDKLFINTQVFYNTIFNSYKNNIDITIPANYITTQEKYIGEFNVGLGVTIKLY